jgi:hypothetical protein
VLLQTQKGITSVLDPTGESQAQRRMNTFCQGDSSVEVDGRHGGKQARALLAKSQQSQDHEHMLGIVATASLDVGPRKRASLESFWSRAPTPHSA